MRRQSGIKVSSGIVDPGNPGKANLISWHPLNETSGTDVFDETGNHDGVNTGATINQTGKVDKCYYLFDNTKYVNLDQYGDVFDNVNSIIAGCVWFKSGNLSVNQFILARYTNAQNKNRSFYFAVLSTGAIRLFFGMDGASTPYQWYETDLAPVTNTGVWYNIAYSVDISDDTIYIWVNKTSYAWTKTSFGANRTTLYGGTETLKIGRLENSSVGSFSGLTDSYVDEPSIFKQNLVQENADWFWNNNNGRSYSELSD